jgi:CheY-like chemotaxis protein
MARILIVDDDSETLAWMEVALSREGHDVQVATSAQRALSLMDQWTPDLVLTDVLMPETDGWAFSRMIARHHIPLMFITVVPAEGEGVIRGASGFIRKPVTPASLRSAVERALGTVRGRPTLLVADDEPEIRMAIMEILSPAFDVLGAENGAEALQLMEQHEVAVLITDVRMPVMDGRELVRRVRRNPRWAKLPVLVQTGDREAARLPDWGELQVERVMSKDEFVDWLLMRIDQTLAATDVARP